VPVGTDLTAAVALVEAAAAGAGEPADLLAALVALRRAQAELAALEPVLVAAAREAGVSWQELAPALGVGSRQAAERRFLRSRPVAPLPAASARPDDRSRPGGGSQPDDRTQPDAGSRPDDRSRPGGGSQPDARTRPDNRSRTGGGSRPDARTQPDAGSRPGGEPRPDDWSRPDPPVVRQDDRVRAERDRRAGQRAVDRWANEHTAHLRRLAAQVTGLADLGTAAEADVDRLHEALSATDATDLPRLLAETSRHLADHPDLATRIDQVAADTDRIREETQRRRDNR
jgi:hypothetical protein